MDINALAIVIAIGFGIFTISGVMITMMLWVRGEANTDRDRFNNSIDAIRESISAIQFEMKDFHHRLEKQDLEFKNFMKIQEEKRTKILTGK